MDNEDGEASPPDVKPITIEKKLWLLVKLMGKLSAEELHEVLQELCLTRNPVKKSESTQTRSLTLNQPKYLCCHISELDILMPSIVPRSERECRSQTRLKEKETCTTDDQDPVITSAYQSEYVQTNPVKLESKISQTTYSSSITFQTDMTGKDILYSKSSLPLPKCCREHELMPIPVSSDRQLAEKGSNTDTFRCCKHRHRSLSRNSFTKARSLTPSRLNESDSEKEVKKKKKDMIYSKKGHQRKLSSHLCVDDIPLNINQDNSGNDGFIEYNKYNMDVYQNIMNWAKSPFFQAEKESKNSCNESELYKIHSSTTYPLKDYSKLRHYIINEEEHNNSNVKSGGCLESVNMKINNPSEHVSYKESFPFFGQEMCLGKTAWTDALPLGLKGDIISNLDKCFRSSMQIPSTALRLTRSDSSVTITKCTEGMKKSRIPQSSAKAPKRNLKAGEPIIYWATTKINVYPDNSRTYEVMPLTGKKPSEVPDKSDSVFVLIPPLKNFPLGCEVKGIWMILRNGARYPPEEQISTYNQMDIIQKEILINHDRYQSGELCEEEIDALRNWTFKIRLNQSMLLSNAGKEELIGIGQRLYTIFPDIFSQNSSSNIITNITSHQISNASAKAFTEGIYGYPLSCLNLSVYDELLMNEMNCSAWEKSTKSEKLKNEVDLLENSPLMEELLRDIKRRLGFVRSLPIGLVKIMYSLCAYESSWSQVKKSPWCAAFTVEHLKVMEYLNDLIYYYKTGYGNPFTKNLGCEILKDMIRWLNTEEHTPTFYFGHSLLIQKLLVSLGIADGDAPLHGDDYKNSTDRQWRTSYLNPFSANLATVLYKCKEMTLNGIQNNFKVAIYVNENIIKLQACNGLKMCDLNDFIQTFSSAIDPSNCNRDFCNSLV